jgi:hypothetical protein
LSVSDGTINCKQISGKEFCILLVCGSNCKTVINLENILSFYMQLLRGGRGYLKYSEILCFRYFGPSSSNEKILYLLQYLSGRPRKRVEGYHFVSLPNTYKEAKQTLEKRFGHQRPFEGN